MAGMKKTILLLLLTLLSFTGFTQIEMKEPADWVLIGQLKFGGITKAKLQYINSGTDTTYMLFIKDVREEPKNNYFAVNFKGIDETYNKLYAVLKSFFLKENKKNRNYSKTFKLGDSGVNIQHHRLLTAPGIMFTTSDGYAYFTENDINKLFDKK